MERLTLYRYHTPLDLAQGSLDWADFLHLAGQAAGKNGAHVLLYSASEARWCRLDPQGRLTPAPGDPQRIFELRVFDGQREWRWLREGATGRGALVAESAQDVPPGWLAMPPVVVYQRASDLLLWGQADDPPRVDEHGFSALAAARIGRFGVPAPPTPRGSLSLTVVEYFHADRHGNPGLLDERLVSVQPARETA